jgi:sulfite exporter TauE/SafE
MCGPIALGVSKMAYASQRNFIISSLQYNVGRTITYLLLGLLFGLIGETIVLSGFQKGFSILAGVVLIGLFLYSLDLEQALKKVYFIKKGIANISILLSRVTSAEWMRKPFLLGLANGLLPCGLVYLALAGSLASGGVEYGALFMLFFGLATIPSLFILAVGGNAFAGRFRFSFRKLLPYVQLVMGIYLIYRGVVVGMPEELDFYTALKNPIMCH